MSIKKQAISGVKWTTISTMVLAVSALLKISVLARFLDKSDFGLMALVTFVLGFMTLFMDMGLTTAILHKQEINKKEYASLYWLNLVFSIALFLGIWRIAPLISSFYDEPELNSLIPLAGISLLLSALGRQFKTIQQKNLDFKSISIIEMIAAVISLIVAVVLATNGYGVYSLVYSAVLQFLISNVLFLIRGLKSNGLLIHFNYVDTKPFLKIGIYHVGGQVANYFNRDFDILIIGKYFGADILGGYSLAKQLVMRPAQVINPILTRVASPILAKYQSDIELLKLNYLKLVNMVSTINIPVYLAIIILAPYVVTIFYGEGYESLTSIVRILCVYMMFRAVSNPIGSLVIATGRTDVDFVWNTMTLILMPIVIWIGAQYSIEGVAISLVITMIILFIPSWKFLVYKLTKASFGSYIKSIIPNWKIINLYVKK